MPNCAHCGAFVSSGSRQCSGCGVTLSGREHATLPGPGYSTAPPAQDAMIGRSIIDQFVVTAKLGEGGMGGVYLADQPTVGRTAVIKVIHPWLSKDPMIATRFETEAKAAARLQNPHIVAIYNYGKLPDGTLFLAMEHIRGSTIAQTLQSQGRLEASRAVNIATQCCEALAEAHRHGVVHRDVKPSNIMLQERHQGPGLVKMLDFGVATIDDREVATGRMPPGTPCYMSPEQLAGEAVDGRSDIYSLAVVIYEMVVGQPPFLAANPEEYARLHREVPPPAPSALAPDYGIPPALEACLMRALAKQPHARPQTAERFGDELWSAVMSAATAESAAQAFSLPPRRRRGRVVRRLAAALVVGVALAGMTLAVDRWRSGDPAPVAAASRPASSAPAASEPDPVEVALMRMSVGELESELERIAVLRGRSPQAVNVAMTTYHERLRGTPPGRNRNEQRRSVLTELILGWARAPAAAEPVTTSIAALEAVFLRMDSPLDVQERRRMLHQLKNGEGIGTDVTRAQLLTWIEQHGFDYQTGEPGAELVLEDEP
ncbi:serine/threonine-protein kinase [Paraliomyxa miuraensis]|uniref:serine/threonine-protein kinase n=1 Tax=Paraliomyxa miuraensis TaxID=376150 RepID=UPI00224E4CA0|nr:serine/threonine-protein kinase [Paraliomyxa miuraensis]MCX4246456.1 serine/threonine protein kinase [Paraliomyxa miuraensis]